MSATFEGCRVLKIELPVLVPDVAENQDVSTSNRNLIELPEWLHFELKTRARLQWEAMQPVMQYNKITKKYHPTNFRKGSLNQAHIDLIKTVKALYEAPIFDPDGNKIEVNEDIFAWWDEYSMQCSMFPDREEFEEAQALVADYYHDNKRFTIDRWFKAKGDLLNAKEKRELGQLN